MTGTFFRFANGGLPRRARSSSTGLASGSSNAAAVMAASLSSVISARAVVARLSSLRLAPSIPGLTVVDATRVVPFFGKSPVTDRAILLARLPAPFDVFDIDLNLSLVGFSERNHPNDLVPLREDDHVDGVADEADTDHTDFPVVDAVVLNDQGFVELEGPGGCERDAMLRQIGPGLSSSQSTFLTTGSLKVFCIYQNN
jgi:hypothetical protein